ncbi:hypothetical protein DEO72_LG11g2681 [Vigna unguiculata]|uniref:Uncharacterized protein n=1 Tax=Vigna unguiculata TaxID=3917 RepID=A0A4D6NT26_VIGUN|nr:hypothetical protein DEO72_LG11g2681 [Vigna unguiculata]
MVLDRRPARFKKPDFMQVKPISEEKLNVLRAAAARVYVNEQNPAEKFSERNRVGGVPESENVREEADNDNGVLLLAAVASGLKRTVDKKVKQGVRKIYPDDISR